MKWSTIERQMAATRYMFCQSGSVSRDSFSLKLLDPPVDGVQHLNRDEDGQTHGRRFHRVLVGEHLATKVREELGTLVETSDVVLAIPPIISCKSHFHQARSPNQTTTQTKQPNGFHTHQLVKGNLRATGEVQEPPRIAKHSGAPDVCPDNHVPKEQPPADNGLLRVARGPPHDIVIGGVKSEGGGRQAVRDEVDPEELYGDEGFGHAEDDGKEDGDNFANVGADQIADELLGVVVDGSALLYCLLDRRKVVVGQDHVCSELSNIRAGAHGDTNISHAERRGVVDTVAGLPQHALISSTVRLAQIYAWVLSWRTSTPCLQPPPSPQG
ncbi:hypothetical protein BC938DRAFT_471005 [Jimgerdemannia flammicorona]|uniref:Uncharacterized protein n=1 Tax=Jimgerdemannia flammicorona TaxID=994334 RepID=A0A433Q914_9FUNG|nr:hypothetical protein BC938DRAFT_471005 [Jimgerdemannia flammicorona]